MSQLESELGQIHATRAMILKKYNNNEISLKEYLENDLKYLDASTKKQNIITQILVSAAKHGKAGKIISLESKKMNLLGEGTAINTGDPDLEMVMCPDLEKLITRAECYETAGSKEHSDDCGTCPNKKITYSKLS